MLCNFLWFCSTIFLNNILQRPLSCFFILISHHFINWRRIYLNLCLYCCFSATFSPNILEINALWTGNSGYLIMLWNDALGKSIAIFIWLKISFTHVFESIGTYHPWSKHDVKGVYHFLCVTEGYRIHNRQTLLSSFPIPITWHVFNAYWHPTHC